MPTGKLEPVVIYSSGSYFHKPGAEPVAVIGDMLSIAGPLLQFVTGGEHRPEQKNWVVPKATEIYRSTGLPKLKSTNGEKYHPDFEVRMVNAIVFRRRVKAAIANNKLPKLSYADWAGEDHEIILEALQAAGITAEEMHGMPSPRALNTFSGLIFKYLKKFEDLVSEQVNSMLKRNSKTVIQFELPPEMAFASVLSEKKTARLLEIFERIVRKSPKGSRFAFHLCWGDLRGRPFVPKWLQRDSTKVNIMNAIVKMSVWKQGWKLAAIHDPCCDGKHPPKQQTREYASYDKLAAFPPGVLYALGILHDSLTVDEIVEVGKILTRKGWKVGIRKFAVAAPCGDGRKAEAHVVRQYKKAQEVAAKLNAFMMSEYDLAA